MCLNAMATAYTHFHQQPKYRGLFRW